MASGAEAREEDGPVTDDRLRLIFTCCHPALRTDHQVALTLRLLGGLSVDDVARSFLVSEAAMAKRLVRAKYKLKAARIRKAPDTRISFGPMTATIWTAIAVLAATALGSLFYLGSRLDALATRVDAGFNAVNARLDGLATRMDAHLDRHAG